MYNLIQNFKKIFFSNSCTICYKNLNDNEKYICSDCILYLEKNNKLNKIENVYFIYYYNSQIKKMINDYKLKNRRGIGKIISKIVKKNIDYILEKNKIDIMIPIPMSKEDENKIGFNQIEEILELNNYNFEKIVKKKDEKYLSKLISQDKKNAEDNFVINKNLNDKIILLITDIIKTESSIEEIIRIIRRKYKIKKIYIFTLCIAGKFVKKGIIEDVV